MKSTMTVIAGEDLKRGDPVVINDGKAFKALPFRWKRALRNGHYVYVCMSEIHRVSVLVFRHPYGRWTFETRLKKTSGFFTAKSAKKAAETYLTEGETLLSPYH